MNVVIHYHGGRYCPPHDPSCNNAPMNGSNEFDCERVPGSNPALFQCSHLI